MSTTPSPVSTWLTDAAAALKNDQGLVDATNADAAATASALALGFLAQAASIGAPILAGLIATAMAGPAATPEAIAAGKVLGNLAAGALTNMSTSLAAEHPAALATLTPDQQALATQVLQTGAALLADKLQPKA